MVYGILDPGSLILDFRYEILDGSGVIWDMKYGLRWTDDEMLDTEFWMQDFGCRIRILGFGLQVAGDTRLQIAGCRLQVIALRADFGVRRQPRRYSGSRALQPSLAVPRPRRHGNRALQYRDHDAMATSQLPFREPDAITTESYSRALQQGAQDAIATSYPIRETDAITTSQPLPASWIIRPAA